MTRMTTRLVSRAQTDRIRVNCLAPRWIATDSVRRPDTSQSGILSGIYSARSALIGEIEAATDAGITAAMREQTASAKAAKVRASGSQ